MTFKSVLILCGSVVRYLKSEPR